MNYREAWSFLDNLQFFKIKLGLESMSIFLDSLGQPHNNLRFVHVAGTNGKGSVSVTLLAMLAKAGYRIGLYTSPHLNSVRERFRINDEFISRRDFARLASKVRSILDGRQITYFEFTTALALLWFADRNVDLAILEVGLGGRLDATNVITPLVSLITSVSMDHEEYLGETLQKVALEKAGIIKPGVPVVSSVADDVCLDIILGVCNERKAPLSLLNRDFFVEPGADECWDYRGIHGTSHTGLQCNLRGGYQQVNSALALAALELLTNHDFYVDRDTIRMALLEVKWPGRLEYFCWPDERPLPACDEQNPDRPVWRFLLDGAHNPGGALSLKSALGVNFKYRKLVLIWASMADKDISLTLSTIVPLCDHIIFTRPESERSAGPEALYDFLNPTFHDKAQCFDRVNDAIQAARKIAQPEDLICIAGSLYLVGAARKILLGDIVT